MYSLLALCPGVRRGRPVDVCDSQGRTRVRDAHSDFYGQANPGKHVRLLWQLRPGMSHGRAQAQARVLDRERARHQRTGAALTSGKETKPIMAQRIGLAERWVQSWRGWNEAIQGLQDG